MYNQKKCELLNIEVRSGLMPLGCLKFYELQLLKRERYRFMNNLPLNGEQKC